MQKLLNNIFSKYYIYFGYTIFSLPFLEFLNSNQRTLERVALSKFCLYFFILSLLYFFFFYILNKIITSNETKIKITFCLNIFFWSLFFFEDIQTFIFNMWMEDIGNNFSAELSIIILMLFSLLFVNLKFSRIIFNFLFFFFIFQHLVIYFELAKANFFEKSIVTNQFEKEDYFLEDDLKFIIDNKRKNKNIYYFVIDNFTSLNQYKVLGGKQDIYEILKFFENNGFTYITNTYSSFNDTAATFGSILNLNPIITDTKDISNDEYFELTYPNNLSTFNFRTGNYPALIENLNKINYKFYWLGNYKFNCKYYNKNLCIDLDKKQKSSFLENINLYILKTFLINTPTEEIIRLLVFNLEKYTTSVENYEVSTFSIKNFIKSIKEFGSNNSNFYFIHNVDNSFPFKYDGNCNTVTSYIKKQQEFNINNYIKSYLNSYDCNLKVLKEFVSFVKNHDPEAIVIIQSDHGPRVLYEDITDLRRYEIFNLVKVNNGCDKYISNQIDNINSVRLALSCATSSKVKLIDKKTYFTDKINVKNYKTIEISTK